MFEYKIVRSGWSQDVLETHLKVASENRWELISVIFDQDADMIEPYTLFLKRWIKQEPQKQAKSHLENSIPQRGCNVDRP